MWQHQAFSRHMLVPTQLQSLKHLHLFPPEQAWAFCDVYSNSLYFIKTHLFPVTICPEGFRDLVLHLKIKGEES